MFNIRLSAPCWRSPILFCALSATVAAGCGGGGGSDAAAVPADPSVRVAFVATDAPLVNPERGFSGAGGDLATVDAGDLAAEVSEGYTLLRSYVRLDDFLATDLTQGFLDGIERGLVAVRASGAKVVLRFSYNDPDAEYADGALAPDASLPQVLRHIEQLAPLLRAHADVIAFVEAGFIGAYGEWHSSASGLDAPESRRIIRDALLAAVPADRFVLFRQPSDVRAWYGSDFDPAEAFGPTPSARVGHHDDCFLVGETDGLTYPPDAPGLREMVAARTAWVPHGGETCETDEPRSACADVLTDGRRYRMTYLNGRYWRPEFHDRWAEQGCLAEVERSLGYRFELSSAMHPRRAARGDTIALSVNVRNVGWAPLYNRRDLVMVLTDAGGTVRAVLPVAGLDPRRWSPSLPPVVVSDVTGTLKIPADLPPGDYDVGLGLPDRDGRLAGDPRRAIRFANADQPALGQRWSAAGGYLLLGSRIMIE